MKKCLMLIVLVMLLNLSVLGTAQAKNDDDKFVIGDLILVGDEGFRDEMAQLGYVDGENTTYLYVNYENYASDEWQADYEQQIKGMVEAGADIFVVNTDTNAVTLQALVGDIPIVFARGDDPVSTQAVKDLINPGGTITGILTNKPHERRLQVLTEINPATDKVYYLYSTQTLEAETVLQQVQTLGEQLKIEIVPAPITDTASLMTAIENVPDGTDWLFLTPYVYLDTDSTAAIYAKSIEMHAGITGVTDMPVQVYLMGYGPNLDDTGRQAARIVDRILRGASPADLPVETAENFLMINLEAAQAIGLDIPESVLRQTNTIIRPGYFDVTPTPEPGS